MVLRHQKGEMMFLIAANKTDSTSEEQVLDHRQAMPIGTVFEMIQLVSKSYFLLILSVKDVMTIMAIQRIQMVR